MSDDGNRCATPDRLEIRGPMQPGYETVLTPAALEFVADLTRRFGDRVAELLAARATLQKRLDDGVLPDFLAETADVRKAQWRVTSDSRRPAGSPRRDHRPDRPQDGHQRAQLRRERLHGGLRGLAHARPGTTSSQGQVNLRDAVRRDISLHEPRRQAVPAQPSRPRR